MNNFTKKIIAGLMLTTFTLTNCMTAVWAMENAKPVLRDDTGFSMKLKGDKNYIQSKEPVSISLRDSDVKQVLRMFADKAGMNIVFHDSVDGKVTLDLVDVPLSDAFDMIMSINNLNYVVDNKTIIVAKAGTSDFNMGKQDMTLIPVKYVQASAMAEFLNKNIFAMNKPGLSNSEIVTTNPATNELIIFGNDNDVSIAKKIVGKFDKKPTLTTFKVNHTTPAEMANMICEMLLGSTGGSGGGSATGGAAGIMTGAADGIALNEGSIACTQDGTMNGSLGLQNLSVAYYTQLGTINVLGGSEHQLEMIKDFITRTDKKQPQAYLEVSIVELNEDGSKTLTNSWNLWSNFVSASFNGDNLATQTPIVVKGSRSSSAFDGITFYRGPVTISYAIDYLVENGKGRVISNPRIIITNGQESKIEVTQDYIESVDLNVQSTVTGSVTTRDYNVSDDLGTTITITPFISPDGYVTLNMAPEYSTKLREITDTFVAGGEEEGGDTAKTYIAATLLSHRNLDLKNIRIKDGETLVIAGMIQELESKTIKKVPVLGDIPGIGALFRSTVSSKTKNELVIMITPKIITDSEDAVGNTDTL